MNLDTQIQAVKDAGNKGLITKARLEVIKSLEKYDTYLKVTELLRDINDRYGHPYQMDTKGGWMEFDGEVDLDGSQNEDYEHELMLQNSLNLLNELQQLVYVRVRYVDNYLQTITFRF